MREKKRITMNVILIPYEESVAEAMSLVKWGKRKHRRELQRDWGKLLKQ